MRTLSLQNVFNLDRSWNFGATAEAMDHEHLKLKHLKLFKTGPERLSVYRQFKAEIINKKFNVPSFL